MGGLNVQVASLTGYRVDVLRSRPRILASEVVKAGAIDLGYRRIGNNLHSCREQDHPLTLPFLKGVELAEGFVEVNFTKILFILKDVSTSATLPTNRKRKSEASLSILWPGITRPAC